jgi:hypothetical protein
VLVAALLGYMFLGKGFAYLHIPIGFRLYVGEITLGLGLLATALRPRMFSDVFRSAPAKVFLLFFFLGVARTLPYVGAYGIDAARDAAIYYYGLFMFLAYELVRDRKCLKRIAAAYGMVAKVFVLWCPVAFVFTYFLRSALPLVPGTNVPLLLFKAGSLVVHVAGAVAFFILGAGAIPSKKKREAGLVWYAGAVLCALCVPSRAGFLALACALATAVALSKLNRLWKPVMAALLAMVFLLAVNPKVMLPSGREVSVEYIAGSARSIFVPAQDARFREGTKRWRLSWWSRIVEETFSGPYFWGGRGFGVNLADAHGFQTGGQSAQPLRSPHSSHMTVLARMGVPGLIVWVLLHCALVWRIYAAWQRARDADDQLLQGVLAWALCFWVASVVNSSFDVILEGPQGAIWFWSAMGLGLAATAIEPQANTKVGDVPTSA